MTTDDERARRIAEAKARAEAARAARAAGQPPPAPASAAGGTSEPPAQGEPAAGGDERARRVAEARARAEAARAARGAAPAEAAPPPAAAAAAPTAPAARPAPAPAAPVESWRGPAAAPSRVITARGDTAVVTRREMQEPEKRLLMTRRTLVRTSFWTALGMTIAGLALGFLNFFWPRQVTGFGGVVKVPASQVPQPGAPPVRIFEGRFYLVNLPPGGGVPPEFQTFAAPSQTGGLLALWQRCPHLGCTVPWRPEFDFEGVKGWFRCPCHGSTYTIAGIRVFGPAPRPMDTMALVVNSDGSVDVDTGKITPGAADNPQRAVLA